MRLKLIWQNISDNGISDELSRKESIKIRLLNQLIFIAFCTSFLIFTSSFFIDYDDKGFLAIWTNIIIELVILVVIYFKYFELSKFITFFFFPSIIALYTINFGGGIGEVTIFMLIGFTALVLYEGQRYVQVIAVMYNCCLYIGSKLYIIEYGLDSKIPVNPYVELMTFPFMLIGMGGGSTLSQ